MPDLYWESPVRLAKSRRGKWKQASVSISFRRHGPVGPRFSTEELDPVAFPQHEFRPGSFRPFSGNSYGPRALPARGC